MSPECALKAKDRLSSFERHTLDKFCNGPSYAKFGRFALEKLHGEDDDPQFHFRLWLPADRGGRQQICRQSATDLPALLRDDGINLEKSLWFWLVQLLHYGLYNPSVKHELRSQVLNRCKNILRNKLNHGGLTVPTAIRLREKELRADYDRSTTGTIGADKEQATTEREHGNGVAPEELSNNVDRDPNDITSSDDSSSDNSSSNDTSSNEDPSNNEKTCHPVNHGPKIAFGSAATVQDQVDEGDSDDTNDDNGDTSSLEDLSLRHRLRSEATDGTYRNDEDEDCESMPDSRADFREDGPFSNAEIRVLHKWRDRFCVQHKMTRAEFQTMMKRSHAPGYKCWTYGFMKKPEFLEIFLKQLPED